jgi:ubiquinone/menaquinone biosynthesis C-methylase UbiE
MERLPFASEHIRLIAANASFHYSRDFRATLSEFERVLTPGGIIAIVDSPFYESAADGERMLADRVVEFGQKYGMTQALARRSRYLVFRDMADMARSLKLAVRWHPVWPGVSRSFAQIRARLTGTRIAKFPVVILEKS